MELYEVMRTTAAVREFTADPVSDEQVAAILENARFASNGGNRQGWHVIVVRDPATRAEIVAASELCFRRYAAQVKAGEAPWNTVVPTALSEAEIAATPAPGWSFQPYNEAPVLLVVCVDLAVVASTDQYLDRVGVISGASVYPFVQNILLAARHEGLGGTLTTGPVVGEPALQKVLGLPARYAIAAIIPLGRPVKQVTKLKRAPVSEFATLERFDGPTLPEPPA
jgi:nitroreductase